jgi:hypothetical protein
LRWGANDKKGYGNEQGKCAHHGVFRVGNGVIRRKIK